ncbi:hypothetical protein ANO11243_056920 [Dothideomycetidae sp. 11243]|nr:hypothetical protein ANO11243_056920 [fungal sp. No.11243]
MDVLYLVPDPSSAPAVAALHIPHNSAHVRHDHQIPRPSDGLQHERHSCICIGVPASALSNLGAPPWTFTLGSDLDADVHLPMPPADGILNLLFRFNLHADEPTDEPALILEKRGGSAHGQVRILDPINRSELLSGVRHQLDKRSRYLEQPSMLTIGSYVFLVSRPWDELDTVQLQRQIAHQYRGRVREDEWRSVDHVFGKGGFAQVELKRGMRTGALRALKVIEIKSERQRKYIKNEIEVMKSIRHVSRRTLHSLAVCPTLTPTQENLVRLHDSSDGWNDAGTLEVKRLILQACHGDVFGLMDRGLAVPHVDTIASQVSAGLDYLHSRGFLHRDLKPENIFFRFSDLGESGFFLPYDAAENYPDLRVQFYIGDFGLSRICDSYMTNGLGTSPYLAPELERGHAYDGAVDMYSLGVTLAYILDGDDVGFAIHQLCKDPLWSTTIYRAKLHEIIAAKLAAPSHPLWPWILRMIDNDPRQRPSAAEFTTLFGNIPWDQQQQAQRDQSTGSTRYQFVPFALDRIEEIPEDSSGSEVESTIGPPVSSEPSDARRSLRLSVPSDSQGGVGADMRNNTGLNSRNDSRGISRHCSVPNVPHHSRGILRPARAYSSHDAVHSLTGADTQASLSTTPGRSHVRFQMPAVQGRQGTATLAPDHVTDIPSLSWIEAQFPESDSVQLHPALWIRDDWTTFNLLESLPGVGHSRRLVAQSGPMPNRGQFSDPPPAYESIAKERYLPRRRHTTSAVGLHHAGRNEPPYRVQRSRQSTGQSVLRQREQWWLPRLQDTFASGVRSLRDSVTSIFADGEGEGEAEQREEGEEEDAEGFTDDQLSHH